MGFAKLPESEGFLLDSPVADWNAAMYPDAHRIVCGSPVAEEDHNGAISEYGASPQWMEQSGLSGECVQPGSGATEGTSVGDEPPSGEGAFLARIMKPP